MKSLLRSSILLLTLFTACESPQETTTGTEMIPVARDPHSFAEPEKCSVSHLNWTAEVDFDKQRITAVARLTLDRKEGGQLILDTRGLEILSVEDKAGNALEFTLGEEMEFLGKALSIQLNEQSDTIEVAYKTGPEAEALQWLTRAQTADKTHPFLFTQSQAILARTWIPIQDGPGMRFTYEAEVTVPSGMLALMSAENPTEMNDAGVYNFRMKQPIPAYLMALAVGNIQFASIGERTGVYAEPSVLEKSVYEFGEMDKMLAAAEKLYGPYAWDRYDLIVLPPSFPFGGMENPRLTFATPTILAGDRSLTSLVAHELAHSWSGNLVTNATWNDFWLNEGFTVYFERRIMEEIYGREYSEMLALLGLQDLKNTLKEFESKPEDTHLKLALEGRNPDDGMSDIAYEKGYVFLRNLEETVGRENFDSFLKNYFETHAFKVMTTEGFKDYLQQNLLTQDSTWAGQIDLDEWFYGDGLPANAPMAESDRFVKVEAELAKWTEGIAASELATEGWSSHEWLHFVRKLPRGLTQDQMKQLDEAFGFTNTGNSEVLAAWFQHTIRNNYEPAYAALDSFLMNVGRRKFLTPTYRAMKESGQILLAREIYGRARVNYHSVSANTMDELLGIN